MWGYVHEVFFYFISAAKLPVSRKCLGALLCPLVESPLNMLTPVHFLPASLNSFCYSLGWGENYCYTFYHLPYVVAVISEAHDFAPLVSLFATIPSSPPSPWSAISL